MLAVYQDGRSMLWAPRMICVYYILCEDVIKTELQEIAFDMGSSATVAERRLLKIPGKIAHQCGA